MLKQKKFPKIFYYDGVTYDDLSHELLSYGRDYFDGHIHTTHFVYFGMYKPFNAIYIEMGQQPNNVVSTMNVEYYNGSSLVSVSNLIDDTLCFNRSAFLQFDKPTDWALQTVNSVENYFIRISVSANTRNNMHIQGMNIVFSDDQDLAGVYPPITNYLDTNEISYILRHENSRDLIIQDLRNRGILKYGDKYENVEPWDILHIDEVRLWSTYLTLANIFSGLQSKESDFYKQKQDDYLKKVETYKASVYLAIDRNDDGNPDEYEQVSNISTIRLSRR